MVGYVDVPTFGRVVGIHGGCMLGVTMPDTPEIPSSHGGGGGSGGDGTCFRWFDWQTLQPVGSGSMPTPETVLWDPELRYCLTTHGTQNHRPLLPMRGSSFLCRVVCWHTQQTAHECDGRGIYIHPSVFPYVCCCTQRYEIGRIHVFCVSVCHRTHAIVTLGCISPRIGVMVAAGCVLTVSFGLLFGCLVGVGRSFCVVGNAGSSYCVWSVYPTFSLCCHHRGEIISSLWAEGRLLYATHTAVYLLYHQH
eukprot:COSAG05_NODE_497_length_9246_cov_6.935343_6_plen_250_part_00